MPSNKREKVNFGVGDKLFSPEFGFVTIALTRGYGMAKEYAIVINGEKIWHTRKELLG